MFNNVISVNNKKPQIRPLQGLLQPLLIATMDFVKDLPKSYGVDTILVVLDQFTNYAHFLTLKHPFTASSLTSLFAKEIVQLHGFPSSIVSNRDWTFFSFLWKEFFRFKALSWFVALLPIPKRMGKRKLWTRLWKPSYVASSIAIIHAPMHPSKWPPFKPYIGALLLTWFVLVTSTLKLRTWINFYKNMMPW